jgi:hypothetical protein
MVPDAQGPFCGIWVEAPRQGCPKIGNATAPDRAFHDPPALARLGREIWTLPSPPTVLLLHGATWRWQPAQPRNAVEPRALGLYYVGIDREIAWLARIMLSPKKACRPRASGRLLGRRFQNQRCGRGKPPRVGVQVTYAMMASGTWRSIGRGTPRRSLTAMPALFLGCKR